MEPTSLNRGEGLLIDTREGKGEGEVGGGEVVVERWWRKERTNRNQP